MSFDLLAPHYRWLEAVLAGKTLQRCRTAWLSEVKHRRRALLVGEGNGRFLSACTQQMPDTHFTVVDASAAMLDRARASWLEAGGENSKATFVHATLPGLKPADGPFDLIVTHCFLDCFPRETLSHVVDELARLATADATWLIADFNVPDRGLARWRARIILGLAYMFFRLSTRLPARELVPPAEFLERNGFRRTRRAEYEWSLLYSEAWERQAITSAAAAAASGTHGAAG